MSKFVYPQVDEKKLREFVDAAGSVPADTTALPRSLEPTPILPEYPWQSFKPDALPNKGINLRLNDYEHQALKWLSDLDDRSLQYTIKRLLKQALESELSKMEAK